MKNGTETKVAVDDQILSVLENKSLITNTSKSFKSLGRIVRHNMSYEVISTLYETESIADKKLSPLFDNFLSYHQVCMRLETMKIDHHCA